MPTVSQFARQRPDFASPSTSTSAILGQLEALDNVLRLSLKTNQSAEPATPARAPAAEAARRPRNDQPNFATAFDLLGRASDAMDVLQTRCTELESSAKVRADHFKMALDVAHEQIKACEERAAAFEAKLAEGAALLAAASERAEAAEGRAEAAERSATDAAEWLKCYCERIISAFGMRGQPEIFKPVA